MLHVSNEFNEVDSKVLHLICTSTEYKRDHSFSTYAKFSGKLLIVRTNVLVHIRGVRNVSFSEYFAYVLNE